VQSLSWPLTVAVWPVESLFVQVIVSPTLAVTVAGLKAKLAMFTATVPAAWATAQPPPPAAADGASLAGAWEAGAWEAGCDAGAADGAVVAVPPPPQAAMRNIVPKKKVVRVRVRVIGASTLRARWSLGCIDGYAGIGRPVSSRAA
jgi:hypothetical protein